MRVLRILTMALLSLAVLAAFPGIAGAAVPAKPTAVSPNNGRVDVPVNPTLEGSAYSGTGTHLSTQWQVDDNAAFDSPEWTRESLSGETATVVNTANGIFANHLVGETALEENKRYNWRFRYRNNEGWGPWSDYGFFFTVTTTWYLAEGCTGGGFETFVLVQNPGDVDSVVDIDFQTDLGPVPGPQDTVIPPNSRATFLVNSYVESFEVSTKVKASSGTIVCERAVYGPGRVWGHDSIGVTAPSSTWYLAEGCAGGDFETWVLVQNPNPNQVTVDISLQTDYGPVTPLELQNVPIAANSRKTFLINTYTSTFSVSTRVVSTGGGVICERAMYGNGRAWGHDSIGTTFSTFVWLFAEGCTGADFETWILVQNPMGYQQEVALFFTDEQGPLETIPRFIVPADSRITVRLNDYVQSFNVATTVATWNEAGGNIDTSGRIICERAMYDSSRTWGHDSIGSGQYAANAWTLPEGCTGGGMETWVLIMNPFNATANATLVFMTDTGTPIIHDVSLPPFTRCSVNVGTYAPDSNVSILVDSDQPVVCERSMYGPGRTWSHNSIGYILGLGNISAASAGYGAAGRVSFSDGFDAAAWQEAFLTAARNR